MSSPKDKLCHCGLLLEYLSRAQMYSCNQNTRGTEEGRRVQEKVINISPTEVVSVVIIIPTLCGVDLVEILRALPSVAWSWFSCGLPAAGKPVGGGRARVRRWWGQWDSTGPRRLLRQCCYLGKCSSNLSMAGRVSRTARCSASRCDAVLEEKVMLELNYVLRSQHLTVEIKTSAGLACSISQKSVLIYNYLSHGLYWQTEVALAEPKHIGPLS